MSIRSYLSHSVRRIIALFAVSTLIILGFVGTAPAAKAVVGDIVLGTPQIVTNTDTLEQWDFAMVTVDWSAPEGIEGGESFQVDFPAALSPASNFDFPLVNSNGVEGGTCSVSGAPAKSPAKVNMVCVLNDAFANMDNVQGTASIQVQACEVTTTGDNTVELTLNGEAVIIELPGEGIIGAVTSVPEESEKWGWAEDDYSTLSGQ